MSNPFPSTPRTMSQGHSDWWVLPVLRVSVERRQQGLTTPLRSVLEPFCFPEKITVSREAPFMWES